MHVFQDALPNEVFALRTQQIVLTVLEQLHDSSILTLKLTIVHDTADFYVEALGRLHVQSEVQPLGANRAHIAGQGAIVAGKPLDLLLAQALLELRREDTAHLPPVVTDGGHAVVYVGQQAALVALKAGMPELNASKETLLSIGSGSHLQLVLFKEGPHLFNHLREGGGGGGGRGGEEGEGG